MKSELITKNEQQVTVFNPFLAELAKLEEANKKEVFDYEDPKGNKLARSHIYKLRQTKTAITKAGKEERDAANKYAKLVISEEKKLVERVEGMIEVHQKPIDEIENREKERIEAITDRLDSMSVFMDHEVGRMLSKSADLLKEKLSYLKDNEPDESYEEFTAEALRLYKKNVAELEGMIEVAEKREAEQAELEALRKEKEAKERAEREERIAKEAAEAATIAAENKAKAEAEQKERAAREAAQAAAQAIHDAELAKQQAEKRAEQAKADAIREQQEKEQAEREAAAKREANKKHHAKINNEAMKCFVDGGLSESDAKKAVELIAEKLIKNVTITY